MAVYTVLVAIGSWRGWGGLSLFDGEYSVSWCIDFMLKSDNYITSLTLVHSPCHLLSRETVREPLIELEKSQTCNDRTYTSSTQSLLS